MMHIPYHLPFFGNWQMPTPTSPNNSVQTFSGMDAYPFSNNLYAGFPNPSNVDSLRCSSSVDSSTQDAGYFRSASGEEPMLDELLFTAKDLPETVRMDP
jgi:hypothetical protein